ncbi:hypothetical protein [uncultured Sphingomonas sp.]|uniref:hypothetical protein n=1 Tax=uncultured Sphingomonas sp. TaxID=158754 RepID=UPI0035CC2575
MMIWLIALAAAAQPLSEAEQLGMRMARAGALATMGPALAERDIGETIADHPEWTKDDIARYRVIARRMASGKIDAIVLALGRAYAKRLSVADMRVLAEAAESPAAARRRAIEPVAVAEAMQSMDKLDMTTDSLAAFCKETGKGCAVK